MIKNIQKTNIKLQKENNNKPKRNKNTQMGLQYLLGL